MKKVFAGIALLLILCTALCACSKNQTSLFGQWVHKGDSATITLHLNEDGTGYHEAIGLSVAFAYKTVGDKITFYELNDDVFGDAPYTFKIKGDKLTLTSTVDNSKFEFTKE